MAANIANLTSRAQVVQLQGRDIYNRCTSLIGQINSLQSSLNAGTAFAVAPDIVTPDSILQHMSSRLQIMIDSLDKMKTDLTIPT